MSLSNYLKIKNPIKKMLVLIGFLVCAVFLYSLFDPASFENSIPDDLMSASYIISATRDIREIYLNCVRTEESFSDCETLMSSSNLPIENNDGNIVLFWINGQLYAVDFNVNITMVFFLRDEESGLSWGCLVYPQIDRLHTCEPLLNLLGIEGQSLG